MVRSIADRTVQLRQEPRSVAREGHVLPRVEVLHRDDERPLLRRGRDELGDPFGCLRCLLDRERAILGPVLS